MTDAALDAAATPSPIMRSVRGVTEREFAIAIVLELAEVCTETFAPLGFYDDDSDVMTSIAQRLKTPCDGAFKNKVIKVCRRLVQYAVLIGRTRQTAKEYIDEPGRQREYTLKPGKAALLRREAVPGVCYGPEGEAAWLLRHAYPDPTKD